MKHDFYEVISSFRVFIRPEQTLRFVCMCGIISLVPDIDHVWCYLRDNGLAWLPEKIYQTCRDWHGYYFGFTAALGGIWLSLIIGLLAYALLCPTSTAPNTTTSVKQKGK